MEQTQSSTMAKGKSQSDNACSSYNEIKSMVSAQVSCTTKQLVAQEILGLVTDSADDNLRGTFKKALTGVSYVEKVVQPIMLDLQPGMVVDKNLNKQIANYLDTSDAIEEISEELLSSNAVTASIAVILKR